MRIARRGIEHDQCRAAGEMGRQARVFAQKFRLLRVGLDPRGDRLGRQSRRPEQRAQVERFGQFHVAPNLIRKALDVAHALGPRLWGVRLDTSEALVDRSLWSEMGDFGPTGVNPRLVWNGRNALDAAGFEAVRIVVSGGFTVDKIHEFETSGVPVELAWKLLLTR